MGDHVLEEMLAKVEPKWRENMREFLDTGEWSLEFSEHLDNDGCENCLALVHYVYERDIEALRRVGGLIQKEREETKRKREEELKKMGFWKRLWYRITDQL